METALTWLIERVILVALWPTFKILDAWGDMVDGAL